jgi:hypothetical protein
MRDPGGRPRGGPPRGPPPRVLYYSKKKKKPGAPGPPPPLGCFPLWGREGVTLANSTECLIQMFSPEPKKT